MSFLYPRLPLAVARTAAEDRSNQDVLDLIPLSALNHPQSRFAPTGGNTVTESHLAALQREVRRCAQSYGYPHGGARQGGEQFDAECAGILIGCMHVDPSEAAQIEMWAFLTCVLLPDIVRWRFPGEQSNVTNVDRFIGGDRGLRRNTFGRLWWRAYLLRDESSTSSELHLLSALHEDELVQITERPSIAMNRELAITVAECLLLTHQNYPYLTRRRLMREAIKRLRRRLSIIGFELLDHNDLKSDVLSQFGAAAAAITAQGGADAESDKDTSKVSVTL